MKIYPCMVNHICRCLQFTKLKRNKKEKKLMQLCNLATKCHIMLSCLCSKTCSLFNENPNQNYIEFQVWHCFHQLAKLGHMCLVHNVWVHNGGINDMEHYPMPPFVIMHSQSIVSRKLILHINSTHVLLVMY